MAKNKTIDLRITQTNDVHGSFFPYNFIDRRLKAGSLARVTAYVDSLREKYRKNFILLDNGDILQGQPICYYSNYVNTQGPSIAASVIDYTRYDAQTIGNHDIETGHAVCDRWVREVSCPTLGANIVNTQTQQPYVHLYTILERDGIKIAVLGMLTPAIPNWLQEKLWSGSRFEDMIRSARYWMNVLQTAEHPDIVVGLFHSGKQDDITTPTYEEDTSLRVTKEVPGFDLILFGHDHTPYSSTILNSKGQPVVCLNPGCNVINVTDSEIRITPNEQIRKGKKTHVVLRKRVNGRVVDIRNEQIDQKFLAHFQDEINAINAFVNRKIGSFQHTIYSRDYYFSSSAFTGLIHNLQLTVTGADTSFNTPLAFDARIKADDVFVSDLFSLYKYENSIYMLKITGEEIRNYLEMSYDLWISTMISPDDHILLTDNKTKDDQQRYGLKNFTSNFDSAADIDYEVDVTKPKRNKVNILKMSGGTPFSLKETYRATMSSYRGNDGGELLTRGVGIFMTESKQHIVFGDKYDQRYYLVQWIEECGEINPKPSNNWKFVPAAWTIPALKQDKMLTFRQPQREEDEK